MAEDAGTNTLVSNLKNKIAFNLHKATYDPEANAFASTQAAEIAKKQETDEKDKTTDVNIIQGDPNKFSIKRVATKMGNQTITILKQILFPFMALMLAMIVANELIIYSPPIRILFFIFVFLICFLLPPASLILGLFYLLKGGYSYYYNHMTDRPKKDIMPTIFSLLPITTATPSSQLSAFFLYPFRYPKNAQGELKLPEIMKHYFENLKESFTDFDRIKNLPLFSDQIKKIESNLMKLHDAPSSPISTNTDNTESQ
jgi:hypothetical protein